MKPKSITYSRRFNLGNFEHEEMSVTLELEDGDKSSEYLDIARKMIDAKDRRNIGVKADGEEKTTFSWE